MKQCLALLLAGGSALAHSPLANSTCGHQCKVDADCVGCGPSGKGKCSIPWPGSDTTAAALLPISATCVEDAGVPPPTEPKPDASVARTPMQHHATLHLVEYQDYTDVLDTGVGDIHSDAYQAKLRHDWEDYQNKGPETQLWEPNGQYYITLKSGVCIHFAMRDNADGGAVGIPVPNWIQHCGETTGNLVYVGRETVNGEWADHYACYAVVGNTKHNRTDYIAFQNWHALGLGPTPLGTPLRTSGSNSHPSKMPPTSRLITMIYSNSTTGNASIPAGIFDKPKTCLPVSAELSPRDLTRAKQKLPRAHLAGESVTEAMAKLNANLLSDTSLHTAPCEAMALPALQDIQATVYRARHERLQEVYAGDNRRLPYASLDALLQAHRQQAEVSAERPELRAMIRDGVCQETVMIYVHHLSAAVRQALKSAPTFVMPLLPERELHAKEGEDSVATDAHAAYVAQATCAVCHLKPNA